MITRIEIRSNIKDPRVLHLQRKLHADGYSGIQVLEIIDVYTIDKQFSSEELQRIGSMLANPVIQQYSINEAYIPDIISHALETGFLPGVTDNIATTTEETIADMLGVQFSSTEGVYVSHLILFSGRTSNKEIEMIALSLINPLINRFHIKDKNAYIKDKGMDHVIPRVKLSQDGHANRIDLDITDEELMTIGKKGVPNGDGTHRGPLALDISYMMAIKTYFKKKNRMPTDVELESLAQTWSEHCKHTIFADPIDEIKQGLFKAYIKRATDEIRKKKGKKDFCVSVFKDNSGAIAFDKGYLVTHKVETHNSPSALDPFGGSITGIVGVNRDTIGFGLGAQPIANMYGFCFAPPSSDIRLYRDQEKLQAVLPSERIMLGVIQGVNVGGNCSGIPTPQGFLYFDERYRAKPQVFVGTVGLIPKKKGTRKLYEKQAKPGDLIVMIGGRVGADGIHGATFSSEALSGGSPSTAVQIGDPITQKKLSDAIVKEARDLGLFNSITDNGAGGLSCSVAEMAKESGGCRVYLEKVPLKYPGLAPWQIWISESQERMTLAIPSKKWEKFLQVMNKHGVEATVIGEFTNSGKCIVSFNKEKVMDMDMNFLHYGLPKRNLITKNPKSEIRNPNEIQNSNNKKANYNLTDDFLALLSQPSMASYEFISKQYDHEVQGKTVLKPLVGRGRINVDATAIRPVFSSKKSIGLSQALFPGYSEADPYNMAACCIDTAIRNLVAIGVNPEKIAILDNFCWCSSLDPKRLWQLKEAVKACYDCAIAYGTPFISGKDSMFNDFKGFDANGNSVSISIPPTLLVSSIGINDDVQTLVSLDTKHPGDLIYIVGETNEESTVPIVNTKKNKKTYKAIHACIKKGLIASSISVHRGGLAYALARMAMAGMFGIDVTLDSLPGTVSNRRDQLFSESMGRMIVTIAPKNKKLFESNMKNVTCALIGTVADNNHIIVKGKNRKPLVKTLIGDALMHYRAPFKGY